MKGCFLLLSFLVAAALVCGVYAQGLVPRNLYTAAMGPTSITLNWTRPEVPGRSNYYSIEHSDPDTGSFIEDNGRYINTGQTVSYTITGLRPFTQYTVRVTSHNRINGHAAVYLVTRTGEGGKLNPM